MSEKNILKVGNFESDAHLHVYDSWRKMINKNLRYYHARNKTEIGNYYSFKENVYLCTAYILKMLSHKDFRYLKSSRFKKVMNTKIYKHVLLFLTKIRILVPFESRSGKQSYWNGDGGFSKSYMLGSRPIGDKVAKIYLKDKRNIKKISRYELNDSVAVIDLINENYNREILDDRAFEISEKKKMDKMSKSQRDLYFYTYAIKRFKRDALKKKRERIRLQEEKRKKHSRLRNFVVSQFRKMGMFIDYNAVLFSVPVGVLMRVHEMVKDFVKKGQATSLLLANKLIQKYSAKGIYPLKEEYSLG